MSISIEGSPLHEVINQHATNLDVWVQSTNGSPRVALTLCDSNGKIFAGTRLTVAQWRSIVDAVARKLEDKNGEAQQNSDKTQDT